MAKAMTDHLRDRIKSDLPFFKIISPATSIGVSNLMDETDKVTLANLGDNVKYIFDDMSSNILSLLIKENDTRITLAISLGLY